MGSFDITCGISNLAIHEGDRTGLVLLNEKPDYAAIYGGIPTAGTTMHTSSTQHFLPYMAPIVGTYDDYGRLRDIEPSAATEFLERKFERPIEAIVGCVASTRGIYDSYGEIFKTYITDKTLFRNYSATVYENLLELGFEENADVPEGALSSYSFKGHKIVEERKNVWTIHFNSSRGVVTYGVTMMKPETLFSAFGYHTGVYPGFKEQDYDKLQPLYDLSGMFYLPKVLREMSDVIKEDYFIKSGTERFNENWDKFMDSITTEIEDETVADRTFRMLSGGNDFLRESTSLTADQYELLGGFKTDDGFKKLNMLLEVMLMLNRYLQPAMGGSQESGIDTFKALNKITNEILDKRQLYYDEEIEDRSIGD